MRKLTLTLLLLFGVLAASAATSQTCNGTTGQWSGCRGNGCAVCWELVSSYPYYFINHPSCTPNTTCGGLYFTCNAACPSPSSSDLQCNGTSGGWQGCRGNGCAVCAELVASYPCYFRNHPACQQNTTCGGLYFTCNANCPAPTSADAC
jgi:ABC-type cobalt transport system substrate-binding protein